MKETDTSNSWEGVKIIPLIITLAVGTIIWFIPVPHGVTPQAWELLAIFVSTIVGIMTNVLPMGAVALIAICVIALTGILDPTNNRMALKLALSGFSDTVICWWCLRFSFPGGL